MVVPQPGSTQSSKHEKREDWASIYRSREVTIDSNPEGRRGSRESSDEETPAILLLPKPKPRGLNKRNSPARTDVNKQLGFCAAPLSFKPSYNRTRNYFEMAEPMAEISPEKLNSSTPVYAEPDMDTTSWHDPPSSPFIAHVDDENQENVAPIDFETPKKLLPSFQDDFSQSAFRVSPEKKVGLQERTSPVKMSSRKQSLVEFEEDSMDSPAPRVNSKKASPVKQVGSERPGSAASNRSRRSSPTKASRNRSVDSVRRAPVEFPEDIIDDAPTVTLRDCELRENEGLTVAMRNMETPSHRSHDEIVGDATFDDTESHPDGPDLTSLDMDDTGFSMFSEMPGIDMTKFAALRQSPTKKDLFDPVSNLNPYSRELL